MWMVYLHKWTRSLGGYTHHLARQRHPADDSHPVIPISRIFQFAQKMDGKSGVHSSLIPAMSCSLPIIRSSSYVSWLISRTNHAWWKHLARMKIFIQLRYRPSSMFQYLK